MKDILGYEGLYKIDEFGNVYSYHTTNRHSMTGNTLKEWVNNIGYHYIRLHKDGKGKVFLVHRLVAMTYIPNPENKPDINHIDGDKSNCHVSNLEWVTKSENSQHMYDTGLKSYNLFNHWFGWSPAQLAEFEQSPYNIPACGNYDYPADLKTSIDNIIAAEKLAVSF